jgi:hypothetical protein
LPKLVAKIITYNKAAADEEDEDMKDLASAADNTTSDGQQLEAKEDEEQKGKEKENEAQEQEDGPNEKGDEWKWLAALLEETYSSIVGVSDKILNSSNFVNPDASINITPLSTPNVVASSTPAPAATPMSGKLATPFSSATPFTPGAGSAPASPSLRATGLQPRPLEIV